VPSTDGGIPSLQSDARGPKSGADSEDVGSVGSNRSRHLVVCGEVTTTQKSTVNARMNMLQQLGNFAVVDTVDPGVEGLGLNSQPSMSSGLESGRSEVRALNVCLGPQSVPHELSFAALAEVPDGSTFGTMKHGNGCEPCRFFFKPGGVCHHNQQCEYCHDESHGDAVPQRRRRNRQSAVPEGIAEAPGEAGGEAHMVPGWQDSGW